MTEQDPATRSSGFDPDAKYVRAGAPRDDGFIEFEFAIGDPELCVELMLPVDSFDEFCKSNNVIMLEPLSADGDWVSRLNEAAQRDIEAT